MSTDSEDSDGLLSITRRNLLIAAGLAGTAAYGGRVSAQSKEGQARITGGQLSLSQAYNVAGNLYQGPDSAKGNVSPDIPRLYIAEDTGTFYYGDNSSWNSIGSLGSGASISVEDDGTEILSSVGTFDFANSQFDVTNPTGDEAKIVLTNGAITVNSGDGLTGGETVSLGGSMTLNVSLDIEDGGTDVTGAYGINFGSNLSVTNDNDGTVTVDGTSGGALTDSGSDNTDGGNIYQLPQTEDSIDGQSGGGLTSFELVSLADAAAQPSANGEIQRSGTDVYIYSGGAARNVSNIGSGGSAITVQEDGSNLTTDASLLNFADGVTASNPTGSEIDVQTQNIITVTSSYTASEQDMVLADSSGGNVTVQLPAPTTDVQVWVKKISGSGNTVTIATPGSETIDGQSSVTLSNQYHSRTIVSDGTNYFIV